MSAYALQMCFAHLYCTVPPIGVLYCTVPPVCTVLYRNILNNYFFRPIRTTQKKRTSFWQKWTPPLSYKVLWTLYYLKIEVKSIKWVWTLYFLFFTQWGGYHTGTCNKKNIYINNKKKNRKKKKIMHLQKFYQKIVFSMLV